jgi:aryl-alcohol dehydrogenase-like predicted oxidoreductase
MPKSTQEQRRKLGSLEVSALGLGCMNMVWAYGPPVDKNQGDDFNEKERKRSTFR